MSWILVPPEQLFSFSIGKETFRLVVLPCFDLCRSNSFCVCICDRICENIPNCGFNNYVLAAILYAYIILSILRVFLVVMNVCLAVLESMGRQLRSFRH